LRLVANPEHADLEIGSYKFKWMDTGSDAAQFNGCPTYVPCKEQVWTDSEATDQVTPNTAIFNSTANE
jgi:hypothetical protein